MSSQYTQINPHTGEPDGQFDWTDAEALERSMQRLQDGREQQASTAAFMRADVLQRLAGLTAEHAEPLARQISIDTGKTIADSRVEVQRACATLTASGEEARRLYGELLPSDSYPPARGKTGMVHWAPLGIVAAITPFNFPINIAAHKIGPAYAAGNSIFFKPPPQAWRSSKMWCELCWQAGIPEDVLQLGLPDVPELQQLLQHPAISCINFTGSVGVGRAIAERSGFRKLLLELGGNDPLIVMADGDVDAAVSTAIAQRFGSAGQRCTAAKRLYIERPVYREFRDLLVERARKLSVGDPLLENTDVGPLVNRAAADHAMAVIAGAVDAGATVALGNRQEGNHIWPTILEDVPDNNPLVREELFAPVMPLRPFDYIDEVINLVNRSAYGLQAGIFSNDLALIQALFARLQVGTLAVNDGPGFRAEHFPFGGVKDSGMGREGVGYAMREMSMLKTLVI